MSCNRQPVDEYTLAAFLAGTLAEERRREVVAYLAENADARELLCMAHEALAAADHRPVAEPFTLPASVPTVPSPRNPARRDPDPSLLRPALRRPQVHSAVAAALAVLVLGIGLLVGLRANTAPDARRGTAPEPLELLVVTPALQFQWNDVADAYYYCLVIYDVEAVDIVDRHETKVTRLGRDEAFLLALRHKLKPGRTYSARIDAVDIQNRTIQRSDAVEFVLEE